MDDDTTLDRLAFASLVLNALQFAEWAHRGQTRRFTGEPYFAHCMRVAGAVMRTNSSPTVVAAALLHDTVEDTDVTIEEIRLHFGDEVGDLVAALTRNDGEPYDEYRVRALATTESRAIKKEDALDNLATLPYGPEYASLRARYNTTILDAVTAGTGDPR